MESNSSNYSRSNILSSSPLNLDEPTALPGCGVTQTVGETERATLPWRVLIFPGATEIAAELRQALGWLKEVVLFSATANVPNHADRLFLQHFCVPLVGEPGWLSALARLLQEHNITHIFPAHDDALIALAEQRSVLSAKVVTSPSETCRIARSKLATYETLRGHIRVPRVFEDESSVTNFPVFVKPDRGQGSRRVALVRSRKELDAALQKDRDRLILEYLPGSEYTIDCFSHRAQGLLFAKGRERIRTRGGIAMQSCFVEDPRFFDIAKRIGSVLTFHGAWFVQVKKDTMGDLCLLEVAPRIGGTSALSRVHGVNLPLCSLYEAEQLPVSIMFQPFEAEIDRALINRYRHELTYESVYVDFDDTLVVNGLVNPTAVKFLYQAFNEKARLILLTRHSGDIQEELIKYRLRGLFDEVIHLTRQQRKADYITTPRPIFIDDSFAERSAVHAKLGIPVFDTSMLELLLDDRR